MGWWRKKKQILELESDIASERGAMLFEDLIECCDGKSNSIKFFSADEIIKATDNFSDSNRVFEYLETNLFQRGYNWYSGKTENHHKILIKKPFQTFNRYKKNLYLLFSIYREGIFCRDITVSSMVSGHKNFLKLVGCSFEFEDPVLVFHGVKKHYKLDISEQPWKRRMKIAEDIATALAYLHTAFPRPFVHTNMSLGQIFLDEDGVAKLTDFSFCVSIPEGETFVQVDIVGTYGYLDHHYATSGVVSEKTDVFAFGILLQRILMGQERHRLVQDDSPTMSEKNDWLFKFLEERRMDEIADPKMLETMGEISEQEHCQMNAFRMLSLRCVGHKGKEVPTMVEVAKELKKIQRSLNNDSSSSSGETKFESPQVISSSVLLSNQT